MRPPRLLALLAFLAGAAAASCHTFQSLEDCGSSRDCPLGKTCNAEGHFCEADTGPIVYGAVLPLTGAAGEVGQGYVRVLGFASKLINDAGGVLGRPIEFHALQDRPTEVGTVSVHTFIDDQRVAGILGGTNSDVSLLIQSIAAPAKVLVISPSATSPVLSTNEPPTDRYFFRTIGVTRRGEALAMGLFSGPPMCKRTLIVDDGSTFAKGYSDAYTEVFQKLGGCVVGRTTVPGTAVSSYAEQVNAIKDARPDCTLLVMLEVSLDFLREVKPALLADTSYDFSKMTWLSASPAHGQDFIDNGHLDPQNPSQHIADGIYVSDADSAPPTHDYFKFRAMYDQYFGLPAETDAPPGESNVFDAAVLFALAVERAGTVADRVAIRDALWSVVGTTPDHAVYGPSDISEILRILRLRRQFPGQCGVGQSVPCEVRYEGASSELAFDAYGTVSVPSAVYQLKDNAFQVVKRYDQPDYDAFESKAPVAGACGP